MSLIYCVDFDDLCDVVVDNTIKVLMTVKERYPDFRCTLFTIPRRTSAESITRIRAMGDWLALAPHGWRHTRGECISWDESEATDKILLARGRGIDAPVFRAPGWLLTEHVYDACTTLGLTVADHYQHRAERFGASVYTYNDPRCRKPRVRPVHGHLTPVCDNFINDLYAQGKLNFASGASFLFAHEAAISQPKLDKPNANPAY